MHASVQVTDRQTFNPAVTRATEAVDTTLPLFGKVDAPFAFAPAIERKVLEPKLAKANKSSPAATAPAAVTTAALARFMVDRATKASMEAVHSCAVDGSPMWREFFEQGLADAIAEEPAFEMQFFEKLCGGVGLPYSAEIIDGYLRTLPKPYLTKFLSVALRKKAHPAAKSFINATLDTAAGGYHLKIVEVFHNHGLSFDAMGPKLLEEMERAVMSGNERFIYVIVPKFSSIPSSLMTAIMTSTKTPEAVISLLIEKCGVPVAAFTDPKILSLAKPSARDYVIGLTARKAGREPERAPALVEEDALLPE